jgi:hypothetical protein
LNPPGIEIVFSRSECFFGRHERSVVGKVERDAVDEGAEFAGVDEEGLFAAVAEAAVWRRRFCFREDPGILRAVEVLAVGSEVVGGD